MYVFHYEAKLFANKQVEEAEKEFLRLHARKSRHGETFKIVRKEKIFLNVSQLFVDLFFWCDSIYWSEI